MNHTLNSLEFNNNSFNPSFDGLISDKKSELVRDVYYGICIAGIPGNILTVIVLCSAKKLREKPINMCIIHQVC